MIPRPALDTARRLLARATASVFAVHAASSSASATAAAPVCRAAVGALCLLLAACGGGGAGTGQAGTAALAEQATVSINATPNTITLGQATTLSWTASNASSSTCTASGAWSGSLSTSGVVLMTPSATGTLGYTISCGAASGTASVTVHAAAPEPTVTLALAPASITTAQTAQLSWSSSDATSCTASGAWSGAKATSGTLTIAQPAGTYNYALTCAGDGGTASGSATLAVGASQNNSTIVSVDEGPAGARGSINTPFVTVTVCHPGGTACQSVDHVLVDTGSFGLRLLAPLDTALALPAVKTPSGADAGECGKFVSGYTWGAVRQADVKIGDETASAISIQVIGDGGASYASVPSTCSSGGTNLGTLAALGAKGILGIGLFKQDCGTACVNGAISGAYYACTSGGCFASSMALGRQVSNPVAAFAVNNNGVLLVLPGVGGMGATSLSGSLVFGVGTQANNAIAGETRYQANSGGDFSTTYKGRTYSASFIDSGSNGYFFNDASLRNCTLSSGFYCPVSAQSLSAANASYDGNSSGTVAFNIVNLDNLASSINAAQVGGTPGSRASASSGNVFDWGLPFFYGRRVFVVFEGSSNAAGSGPYWAY